MVKEVDYQLEKFTKYSLNNIVDWQFVKYYYNLIRKHKLSIAIVISTYLNHLQQMSFNSPSNLAIFQTTEQVNLK